MSVAISLPLSTAEVERVFSQVKLVKTPSMKTSSLSKLLMIKLNCDHELFKTKVLDKAATRFFAAKNRRLPAILSQHNKIF